MYQQVAREIADAQGWSDERLTALLERMIQAIQSNPERLKASQITRLPTRDRVLGTKCPDDMPERLGLVTPDDVNAWLSAEGQPEWTAPTAQAAPEPKACATPWHLLATPAELIAAFGTFTGMTKAWFNAAKDTPELSKARHTAGQGGRNGREPLYFVLPVMQWLIDPKRRKGKDKPTMREATGWRVLRTKFPKVYEEYQDQEPNPD